MNPFTRFLSQRLPRGPFTEFVRHWDELEALVIRVYKAGRVAPADETVFDRTWPWLQRQYPRWAKALAETWPETRIAGQIAPEDPFQRLLAAQSAAAFVGDWAAMQHLPAAREALNRYLLAQANRADG